MRTILKTIAAEQEKALRENDHKTHWNEITNDMIGYKIREHAQKLTDAICIKKPSVIKKSAVDLANYCAMAYDKAQQVIDTRETRG